MVWFAGSADNTYCSRHEPIKVAFRKSSISVFEMCKYSLSLVYLVLVSCIGGQAQEGTLCETSRQETGVCRNIYNCQIVTDILSDSKGLTDEKKNYVRSLKCGFLGNVPLVCCPSMTRSVVRPEIIEPDIKEELDTKNFLLPPKCGKSNATLPRVVGGVPANLGEFPWMVALGYQNKNNPNLPKWLCGGSLITSRHVLTAAHCVYERADLYLARVGEHDLYSNNEGANPVDIQISKTKVHEEYSATRYSSDIAIVTLAKSTENLVGVLPICLPWETDKRTKSYLKKNLLVIGWGAVYFNGPKSSVLQKAEIPVIDNSFCANAYANRGTIDERVICAGYTTGSIDACQGDSGGPFMYGQLDQQEKGIRFYQIGIVSYGIQCADGRYPGVYTKVIHFLNWIAKNIRD